MTDVIEIMEVAINDERDKIRITAGRGFAIKNCKGLLLARAAQKALTDAGYRIAGPDEVIVPRVPTEAMIKAGKRARESAKKTGIPYWAYPYGSPARGTDPEAIYKAMLAEGERG